MANDTVLCWRTTLKPSGEHVTVADYTAWMQQGESCRKELSILIKERLRERYIDPVTALPGKEKNGFAIMALSCLLMETLESFYQGWPKSPDSARAFCYFFDRQRRFDVFRGYSQAFYKNVRCGILHQGETTEGWTITRKAGRPMFDPAGPTVHATEFHSQMAACVNEYAGQLARAPINDGMWVKFFKKMDATIRSIG